MLTGLLWIPFTLLAAAGQTARNAMQRELTATLGTVGATHVRFLFGFPFALLSLIGVLLVTGVPLPRPSLSFWPWVIDGAGEQIAATALMLMAMGERSFSRLIRERWRGWQVFPRLMSRRGVSRWRGDLRGNTM